jgi:hypothetical protein
MVILTFPTIHDENSLEIDPNVHPKIAFPPKFTSGTSVFLSKNDTSHDVFTLHNAPNHGIPSCCFTFGSDLHREERNESFTDSNRTANIHHRYQTPHPTNSVASSTPYSTDYLPMAKKLLLSPPRLVYCQVLEKIFKQWIR